MPKSPRFIHAVRRIRTCLGHTQQSFAQNVGCSAITIQRIENGSLRLSTKLADIIFRATGANPSALLEGKALDMEGRAFTKESSEQFKSLISTVDETENERNALWRYVQLLLIASDRAGQDKRTSVVISVQKFLKQLAVQLNLEKNVYGFLIERGIVRKRSYRVSDLRKFPVYANIIGFKDNKRYKPTKIVTFQIPMGWINDFDVLEEIPVLPKELEKEHADKFYLLDSDLPVPKEVQVWLSKALYWKIKTFRKRAGG